MAADLLLYCLANGRGEQTVKLKWKAPGTIQAPLQQEKVEGKIKEK